MIGILPRPWKKFHEKLSVRSERGEEGGKVKKANCMPSPYIQNTLY